jgi:thiol-disulfide isomerase/thioredoxin
MKTISRAIFAFAFLCLGTGLAAAGGKEAFSQVAFEAAERAGGPILVDVSASWCPTCRAQAPILDKLVSEPKFKNFQVFVLDFDSQKDLLRMFGVQQQSTLIVFHGQTEVGRSVGDTGKASIEALLAKGL